MPVAELLDRIDAAELTEWMAYEHVRPASREEIMHAELMHWIGCLGISKRPPPISFFLPERLKRLAPAPRPQTPEEIRDRLGALLGRK